ncbi:MAG: hypothetical protein HUJ25_02875 [Crocinitomicaceae bacterium]|nr:hypothetical protein [Crocinitomicaceae bacterium]
MRKIFTLFILTLFFGTGTFAQRSYVNYNKDSRWFIGINGGATWHTRTEVDNIINGGYGFTFGRSFGMRPEKLFSWDLRFRYLHGWWGGQATSQFALDSTDATNGLPSNYPSTTMNQYGDSLGYFIPNFRSQLLSGSLELALNTNRLRENTGWNIQIFGGIGAKGYNTRADLLDGSGQIYDYNNITQSKTGLLSAQDGDYETNIIGDGDSDFEWDWAASFGAGISYQIAPWASIGISHKMTWTRRNDFDLMPNDVGGVPTGTNDVYHYSSAGIKFHLFGGNYTHIPDDTFVEDTTSINNFDTVDDPVVQPAVKRPIVDIYDPGVSPYTVEYNQFTLRANVHHVEGRQYITFKQNGNVNNNFTYNAASDKFQSSVVLQPGQNIFEITAWNDAGQDYESTIIIYKPEEPVIEPPIVTITNPAYTPYTTPNSTFNFAATVLNVDSKSQIKVYFNGQYLPNFTYNLSSKNLFATLSLQEGTNTVMVTATNDAGSDSKTAKIIYQKPTERQPPIVNFTNPANDPYNTTNSYKNITASVLNVDGKANIKVFVNGHSITNFTYNVSTKNVNFNVTLQEGANVLEVTGTNESGTDYDNTTIIYNKPESPKPPVVTYLDPAVNPTIVYNSSYNVTAKVLHVNSASDIVLKINGIRSYNFAYSTSSKEMTFTTNLVAGSNVIEITGTNQWGSDVETTTIIYRKVVSQAPPVVNITYPASDNEVFNTSNLTLSASVLNVNNAANIHVLVNGNVTTNFTYNTSTKVLYLPLTLVEGANNVKITGTNSAGSDNDTRIIIYKRPTVPSPPTVNFVNPPTTPYIVSAEDYTITANTTNIDTKSQISLLQNGVLIPDALYTFTSSHQIIYNSQLIPGSNIFEVIVTNNDGTASDMAIVTYKIEDEPCVIPTVGYISPTPYSTIEQSNVTIDAQINNHSPETTVELVLNGASQGYMTYNQNTSIASKAITLAEGSNAITVIVNNNCGRNQATFTLNYVLPETPCVDPTVVPIGQLTMTTQDQVITLQSGVSEVTSASNISVNVNGQTIPFNYDPGTHTVTIENIPLALGNNAVVVQATNDCGSASITYHITREACNLPLISNASHNSGFTSTTNSIPFTIKVANATASEIQMLVNNISQAFNFNNVTDVLSAGIDLAEGANTIVITATNACGTSSESYTFNYEIPCVNVGYSLLNPSGLTTTVTDPNYSLLLHTTGTLEASGVSATLNGTAVSTSFDPIAGNISINGMTLQDGANIIVINLTNDCSSETITYTINYDGCQPPVITISGTTNGAVFNSSTLPFQANVQNSNGAGNIVLTLNGQTQSFDFNDQTNILTSNLDLVEGANTISLVVNGCETASESITVSYVVPCQPITYNLVQPATTSESVVNENYQINLTLYEVTNQQQINVKHNGTSHPFNFDAATHVLSVDGISLVNGANTIVITATNDCSAETITYNVQYNGCQPPVITLGNNPASVTAANYPFTATVTNISNQNNVQILVNNAPINFVFQNGLISAEALLIEGQNTITINAVGCETDSESFTVNYTIPCDPIVYSLSSPAQLETSIADPTYTLSLVAQHVQPNSITVKLNGTVVPHTYANDLITVANMQLISGDNTVVVSMSNPCSNETVSYTIHHNDCNAPVINMSGNPDAVTVPAYNLSAIVSNIDNQNNLTLTLNGAPSNFSFDPGTGNISAALQLNEGTNTIVITANGCASTTETFTVNYSIPCLPVSYTLASPSSLTSVVNGITTNVSLNVQNVENSQAISAQLNGAAVNFTFANDVISLNNVNLVEGSNTITITFGNDCSSETVTYTIESDQCDTPIININNSTLSTTDPIYTFTCNVQNIDNGNNLSVSVNGQTVNSNFTNGVLTAQMTLQEGPNEVTVTANGCETTSITATVTYTLPCNPITFTHVTPVSNDTIYQTSNNITVKINALNVQQSGVTATLNGNPVNFTYLGGGIQVITQNLVNGNNTLVIHMTNECSQSDAVFHIVVGEPCNPPVIAFSSSSSVTESAYTLNATVSGVPTQGGIVVKLNNQAVPFNFSNGNITANLTLNQGNNTIKIEAAGCANSSSTHTVTYNPPAGPCGPRFNPGNSEWEFCLITPNGTFNRDDLANNSSFSYSGPASSAYFKPIAGGGDAVVNGQAYPVQNGQYYLFTGSLNVDVSSTHPGSMGHWEICIQSNVAPTYGNGNNRPASPCESKNGNEDNGKDNGRGTDLLPKFTNVNPSSLSSTVSSPTFNFRLKVENVTDRSGLSLYLNQKEVRNFSYDNATQLMASQLNLNSGVNTIKVLARNGTQSNEVTFSVNYKPAITTNTTPKPVITNINPTTTSAKSQNSTYAFKAKVENASSQKGITLYVNGKPFTNFVYSSSSKQVSAILKLNTGVNTIKLVAINGNEKTERTYSIDYSSSGPITTTTTSKPEPVITNVYPTSTSAQTKTATYSFKVKVENVDSKSAIKISLNGKSLTAFSYSSSTKQVSAVLLLRSGSNTVQVTATGGGKTVSKTYTINYSSGGSTIDTNNNGNDTNNNNTTTTVTKKKPVITSISPSSSSTTVSSASYTFKAKVANVDSKSDIKLYVNGSSVSFSYSSTTGQVTAALNLRSGSNSIKIRATNGGQTTEKSFSITYKETQTRPSNTNGSGGNTKGGSTNTGGSKTTNGGSSLNTTNGGTKTTNGGTTTTGGNNRRGGGR